MKSRRNFEFFNFLNSASVAGNEYFDKMLTGIFRFNQLEKVYAKASGISGDDFIGKVLDLLNVTVEFNDKQLKRIPEKGPVIVIANHPLGGIERLLLIKYLGKIRNDIKILGNPLLQKVDPLAGYFITQKPQINLIPGKKSTALPDELKTHLENGGMLCLFPSGSGSTFHPFYGLTDKVWQLQLIKFIKETEVPVLPVFFQGKPGKMVAVMMRMNPVFSGFQPSDKKLNLKIRIGNPISLKTQKKFADEYQFGRYLRAKTFGMQAKMKIKPFFIFPPRKISVPEPVIEPVPQKKLLKEIKSLEPAYGLFNLKNYSVYAVPSARIPNIMQEIGRLREITFREVGEGTNRSIDIDEYDLYYDQLFIWDNEENKLVGAYRIGPGREIMSQYGIHGFYISTLFIIHEGLSQVLNESLELGRSFIVSEYQRKPLPLFMLWKGILYFLLKNPQYRYLIGPASISNNYSAVSKDLIIRFITENHSDNDLASFVLPRNEYKPGRLDENIRTLLKSAENDIEILDKTVADLEEQNIGLPVLLKKYIQLNARILGFNVDPAFNDSIDGLIFLDVFNIPMQVLESLSKDVNDDSILVRFQSTKNVK